jgi:hypothetical protein
VKLHVASKTACCFFRDVGLGNDRAMNNNASMLVTVLSICSEMQGLLIYKGRTTRDPKAAFKSTFPAMSDVS